MTEHCGVVRSEDGLRAGLRRLDDVVERTAELEVRPDLAGYADLCHAFDLEASLLAARATLECALVRRETRGAHNRVDFPHQDPAFQASLLWTPDGSLERELPAPPSRAVAALARHAELEVAGRLVE
jgi:succinate dehydrogenase / fumarate reductase flavoprotein subunit